MKRIYYYVEVENISPIHVGNGENNFTDLDLIRDKNNQFFIPGTSLAGSIIHQLNKQEQELLEIQDNPKLMKQSPLFISDALMKEETSIEVRDGIKLNKEKITENTKKYDYEIIPAGQHFVFRMEMTQRGTQSYDEIMNKIFMSIQNQDIKVGYKTTRGLGRLKIIKLGQRIFDANNYNEYFEFDRFNYQHYYPLEIIEKPSDKYTKIEVSLHQNGGLSIRTYNTMKDKVDYEHIHSAGKPVIPATSWNGLLRNTIEDYIPQLKLNMSIDELFGTDKPDSKKSKIFIDESQIKDGFDKEIVRNRINPFHGGTVQGALYNERTHYNGKTKLVITIDNQVKELDMIIKLLILFLKDLDNGFIALGGQTSIGRGLFKVDEILINQEQVNLEKYLVVKEEYTC